MKKENNQNKPYFCIDHYHGIEWNDKTREYYDKLNNQEKGEKNTNLISDGYHTFGELYEHRIALFIALCKQFQGFRYHGDARNMFGDEMIVWRSKKHSDNSAFDGWFILGMYQKKGEQITYHLPLSKWEDTNFAETLERAPEFDGHTSNDVIQRLYNL